MRMNPVAIGQFLRSHLPDFVFRFMRESYFVITASLGPKFAYWQLRRSVKNPQTFGEKVRYKIAFDRDPILTRMSDKIAARELVTELIGQEYLTDLYAATSNLDEIDWENLPRQYMAKSNHGSKGCVMVWDGANPNFTLPTDVKSVGWEMLVVRPEQADPKLMKEICAHFLGLKFWWYKYKALPEWAYEDIKPGILIEELLLDHDGNPAIDFKFAVIHGKVKFLWAMSGRFSEVPSGNCFDREWNQLPIDLFTWDHKLIAQTVPPLERPRMLDAMIEVAERLGTVTDAVRIDLYCIGERIVFGEFTPYPAAGANIVPAVLDAELGASWNPKYEDSRKN